jgi:hypothetical protein
MPLLRKHSGESAACYFSLCVIIKLRKRQRGNKARGFEIGVTSQRLATVRQIFSTNECYYSFVEYAFAGSVIEVGYHIYIGTGRLWCAAQIAIPATGGIGCLVQ